MEKPIDNVADFLLLRLLLLLKAVVNLHQQLPKDRQLVIPALKSKRNQGTDIRIQQAKKLAISFPKLICRIGRIPITVLIILWQNFLVKLLIFALPLLLALLLPCPQVNLFFQPA